jgi:hypothetical protein
MRKQYTIFVKDVNVPTDFIGSRNTSYRWTGFEIMMNIKFRVVPVSPRVNAQAD